MFKFWKNTFATLLRKKFFMEGSYFEWTISQRSPPGCYNFLNTNKSIEYKMGSESACVGVSRNKV